MFLFFKIPEKPSLGNQSSPVTDTNTQDDQNDPDAFILCINCKHLITHPDERIEVNGLHEHAFANPHGIVFNIGCFQTAPGCSNIGMSTSEFSWFKGYQWRIAVCTQCGFHLGWFFSTAAQNYFYGLIVDHLIKPKK